MSWFAVELYKNGMVKLGEFKLSSGLYSPFYIDMRRLYSFPDLTRRVVQELISRVPFMDIDVIVGVESAGIPLAAYIACFINKPMAYVRKEKKNYATGLGVEGDVSGKRALVIDDVVTTGNSLLKAIGNLKEAGSIPVRTVVLVDREQGALENLYRQGVELYSLATASSIFRDLYIAGLIEEGDYINVIKYLESFKSKVD
ncbi:MAG: orotate phosphoribosyltransferase [Desulfurococcaceae archaeon]